MPSNKRIIMGKNIRHRDEILRGFHKDVHNTAEDQHEYTIVRDMYFLEVLCDIRDNLHHVAKNIQDFDNYEEDGN